MTNGRSDPEDAVSHRGWGLDKEPSAPAGTESPVFRDKGIRCEGPARVSRLNEFLRCQ